MIPRRFTLDALEQGMGGVQAYGTDLECVACRQCGAIVVVALLARHPHDVTLHEGAPAVPLVKLTEPKPPRNEEALREWQRVALEKWRHYRDNVYPSGNTIATSHHEFGLAKLIPYLLGMPEEALDDVVLPQERIQREDVEAVFGPDSGILPDTEPKPERIINKRERK